MRAPIVVASIAALVLVAIWLAVPDTRSSSEATPAREVARDVGTPRDEELVPVDRLIPAPETEKRSAATTPEPLPEPRTKERDAPRAASTSTNEPDRFSLRAEFAAPDGSKIRLASATVELVDERGVRRLSEARDAMFATFSGLPLGIYTARVHTNGFRHCEQELDLRDANQAMVDANEEAARFTRELVLWPKGWVAVIVRGLDGGAVPTLAEALQLTPRNLLVDAFSVRARLDAPDADAWNDAIDMKLAIFRGSPSYDSYGTGGSAVGSLRLLRPPPMWIGLAVHGTPMGWELLEPEQDEVVFRLDAQAIALGLAQLKFRVVDSNARPAAGALVILKSDKSAHRRQDLQNVPVPGDGRLAFDRLVPGAYEFYVESEGALFHDRVHLAPGEDRDLGDIVLPATKSVLVRVVDANGAPEPAIIEIGPYRAMHKTEDLYPPNLHRSTANDGTLLLPLPTRPSILRATAFQSPQTQPTSQSINTFIDPAHPPTGEITFVVHTPLAVTFDARHPKAWILEVLDELDLVVASPPVGRAVAGQSGGSTAVLRPGRYRARLWDEKRTLLGEVPFVVERSSLSVRVP